MVVDEGYMLLCYYDEVYCYVCSTYQYIVDDASNSVDGHCIPCQLIMFLMKTPLSEGFLSTDWREIFSQGLLSSSCREVLTYTNLSTVREWIAAHCSKLRRQ